MSRTLSRLSLTAALLTPLVTLDWSAPRRRGATAQTIARIGVFSDVIVQSVDPDDDLQDFSGGLSAWSRARTADHDPLPIRLWAFSRLTDGTAWQQAQRTVHHRLLLQAQAITLLTGRLPEGALDGLRLTDVEAARRTVTLVSGRISEAETVAGLLHDLHVSA